MSLKTGYKAADQAFEQQAANSKKFVNRFWLPPGKNGRVVFLTDKPVIIEEHSIPSRRQNGKKRFDRITSPASFNKRDPLKEAGSRTSMVAYYTVIDLAEWEDKRGGKHKNEKRLLGVKQRAFEAIKRRRAEIIAETNHEKSLVGAVFKVYRGEGKQEEATGTDWQFKGHISRKKMLQLLRSGAKRDEEVTLEALDYATLLAPPAKAELLRLARRLEATQSSDDDDYAEQDEDEDDLPRKKKRARDDEDADESLFGDDDEDEDERPKKKKKKVKAEFVEEDDEEEDDDEDDEEEDDEDDEKDDDDEE